MHKHKKKHSATGQYLVIPLNLTEQPFATDDIQSYRDKSHYVVHFDVIKAYANTATSKSINLKVLLAEHVELEKKMTIKNMGEFGDAAFAKSTIQKGLRLIYSGLVSIATDVVDANNMYAYMMLAPENEKRISVDGDFNRCQSRFLQHLPNDEFISDGAKKSSYANFGSVSQICSVVFNNKIIYIPFIVLQAKRLIASNKLLGFDYGIGYWRGRDLVPTYFTEEGVPLNSYRIHCKVQPGKTFAQSINVMGLNQLVEDGYFINENEVTLFPPESLKCIRERKDYLTTGALLVEVPAIIKFALLPPGGIYRNADGEDIFLLPSNNSDFTIDASIESFAKFESIDDRIALSLIINRILKLSYTEWKKVTEFVNKLVANPLSLIESMRYSELTYPLVLADEPLPLFSLTQSNFFKTVANNFNDKHSALAVTMRTLHM